VAEPVRILRLITRLNAGGPARHAVWLSAGMKPLGYETQLLAGRVAGGEDDLSSFARECGVTVREVDSLAREINLLSDRRALRRLADLIQGFEPDIVHTHTAKAGLLGRWTVRRVNSRRRRAGLQPIRAIHTFHGNVLSGYFSRPRERLFRWLESYLGFNATDAIIVLSPQQRYEIVEKFRIAPPERVFVIPLALDLSSFERLPEKGGFRRELRFGEDDYLVGIVGRIAPIKNHALFLRAAALLAQQIPRACFVVVGGGRGLEELVRVAGGLGISDRVRFVGVRSDLPVIYSDLDVLALSSRNEGTPLSLIEAMAAGRPVVATDVGGVRDLLTTEWRGGITAREFVPSARPRGLLVKAGDADGFASALSSLAREPALPRGLGEAGREYAFRHHGLPRLFDDLNQLYRLTLSRS